VRDVSHPATCWWTSARARKGRTTWNWLATSGLLRRPGQVQADRRVDTAELDRGCCSSSFLRLKRAAWLPRGLFVKAAQRPPAAVGLPSAPSVCDVAQGRPPCHDIPHHLRMLAPPNVAGSSCSRSPVQGRTPCSTHRARCWPPLSSGRGRRCDPDPRRRLEHTTGRIYGRFQKRRRCGAAAVRAVFAVPGGPSALPPMKSYFTHRRLCPADLRAPTPRPAAANWWRRTRLGLLETLRRRQCGSRNARAIAACRRPRGRLRRCGGSRTHGPPVRALRPNLEAMPRAAGRGFEANLRAPRGGPAPGRGRACTPLPQALDSPARCSGRGYCVWCAMSTASFVTDPGGFCDLWARALQFPPSFAAGLARMFGSSQPGPETLCASRAPGVFFRSPGACSLRRPFTMRSWLITGTSC